MGATVSVRNETPYTWYYSNHHNGGFNHLGSGDRREYKEELAVHRYIYLRYNGWNALEYEFNTHKGNPTFSIRESWDRSQIELHCSTESNVQRCPNYGKQEDDQRQEQQRRQQEEERRQQEERRRQEEERRRQEEERRRQERLEQERRIQEQIDKESEISREKLSRSKERLREKLSLRGQVHYHERTQVLHQQIEDDAEAIERNELEEIEQKFKELLSKHEISESEDLQDYEVEERIKMLHNELTIKYCSKNMLSVWSQFTFDQAVGYEDLSLTEKFNVLEAVLQLTLQGIDETDNENAPSGNWDMKYEFLFCLVEELYIANPTLAEHIFLNVLISMSELSSKSKETLCQILFNNIWTPTEIMLFLRNGSSMDQNLITQVLHLVRTYRLACISAVSALNKEEPLEFVQQRVKEEKDKDTDDILRELSESQCPENLLEVLEDVITYMEKELPKYQWVDLNQEDIENGKMKIKSLDFANPDIDTLKEVLIGMSIAVQDCSTFTGMDGKEIQGYFPRLTQLASLLLLLLSKLTANKGCLLEIGTGEGKSCILAMFATIQAIRGIKVDIVTSSPVLARRDQEEWKKLFDMFGVTSSVVPPPLSHACSTMQRDQLLQEAYEKQVVYGTVGSFAADTLKQEFERRTTRGNRGFELVIVDEVDYMTLDNGVQVTFLSHESTGLRHMDQILANIWTMVSNCQPIEIQDTGEIRWATKIQHFHKAATAAVMGLESSEHFSAFDILLPGVELGFYSPEDIERFQQAESEAEAENTKNDFQDDKWKAIDKIMEQMGISQQYDLLTLFQEVMENSVAIECYTAENNKATPYETQGRHADLEIKMLLLDNGLACEIMSEKSLIEATVSALKSSIKYSDIRSDTKDSAIIIPHFLRNYVENQLPVFVENALRAIEMTQGREYMIDTSPAAEKAVPSGSDQHQYDAIIPVDFKASGVLEKNKKWGNGLQQFLEMKHQLAISPLSSVTNFMSNFHFFKRYIDRGGIFGVSGTLGGNGDKGFLERHYKSKSFTIPAHRHKKVIELPAMQVHGGNNPWVQTVCETAWKVASNGQVVLLICEDVRTANELHAKMQEDERFKSHKITMYTISEKHNIEKEKFSGGNIIIATNLGGRGTDIKVDEKVNECGGLFVLLTHFPRNRRVEKQIFGRTARKGNPGMVQMVLNGDHLAPAYQRQSVEIMRQLREEYEVKRILEMENDELLEINLKEKLFSTFCQSLGEFDSYYTDEEREDLSEMKLSDIPDHARKCPDKFDYHPALNALKEAWALWLILHEEHINRHDDIHVLQADLIETMNQTTVKLLQGTSDNFYDHIRQAVHRTGLHSRDKHNSDYGAKALWQKVANAAPLYNAVALYNQAYITINRAQGDYKKEAMELLKQAKVSVDVPVTETSNTMVACQMSANKRQKPHSTTSNNFQGQMGARMNLFKSWLNYIDNAIKKLEELEKDNNDAITEECSVYMLLEEKDFIVTNELMALYEHGLGIVFEVKKKPKFCFDALICFFIGLVQVLAGVLVCALSCGTATQFGLGLINEGVSDMISGIQGMITGTFDWVSWAISKSISIGMSLLTAGFSAIKNGIKSVYKAAKSLRDGTKTFSSIASDVIKSGRKMISNVSASSKSVIGSVGKDSFRNAMKSLTTSTALKQNLKHAARYAVQELGTQGVITGLNHALDAGLKAIFEKILDSAFKRIVTSAVRQNTELQNALTEFICRHIPKTALQKADYKVDNLVEKEMTDAIEILTEQDIHHIMMNCTTVHEVIGRLTEVVNGAKKIMDDAKRSGIHEAAKILLKVTDCSTHYIEILNNIPSKKVIDESFVPKLLKDLEELMQDTEKYDRDGRHNLTDVQRLKEKLLCHLTETVSESFIKACSGHMTSFMTKSFKNQLNKVTSKAVGNVLGRQKTQSFFDDQRHKHNLKSTSKKTAKPLTDKEKTDLMQDVKRISDENKPATAFDILVLTKSDLLKGKGIQLTVVDEHGKKLSDEVYEGKNPSAGNIKLRLTKQGKDLEVKKKSGVLSWIKEKVFSPQPKHYTGHFDIEQDGKLVKVNSEKQNCLYHAVAQASASDSSDLKGKAQKLRNEVKNEVQNNLDRYAPMLKLQRSYDYSHKNPGKYAIIGGTKKKDHSHLMTKAEYSQSISSINTSSKELKTIKGLKLGAVGKYKHLKGARKSNNAGDNNGTANADHIPPKNSVKNAWDKMKSNSEQQKQLKNSNPALYNMMQSIQTDNNGENLITMEVLAEDHRCALTTGASNYAKKEPRAASRFNVQWKHGEDAETVDDSGSPFHLTENSGRFR